MREICKNHTGYVYIEYESVPHCEICGKAMGTEISEYFEYERNPLR
jgi:hypothetical protein